MENFLNRSENVPETPITGNNKPTSDIAHEILSFDDNKLAGMLFGKFDENLALIEQKLEIEAVARGNRLDLRGDGLMVHRAKITLETLYAKLLSGEEVNIGDVDGAIRMSDQFDHNRIDDKPHSSDGKTRDNAGSKFRSAGKVAVISTYKKKVNARSPVQSTYMEAMAKSELVFGIGPAGTGKTYLAVAYAASLLENGAIDRIILTRPAVEAGSVWVSFQAT